MGETCVLLSGPRMTLAAILLLGVSSLISWSPGRTAQAAQSPAPAASAGSSSTPNQTPPNLDQTGTAKPSSDQTPNTPAPAGKPKPADTNRSRHKKKAPPDCDPAPANSTTPGSPPPTKSPAPQDTTNTTQKPCAPPKIVVRKGGISEQSIQLEGSSASDDPSQKRDAANRMLAATEENLKKIAGLQLSSAQQTAASQIRQFVKQSKSALAAGDLERAQTLAWKAKLLSDDLVNPGK